MISVVVPVRNRANIVGPTLQSIARQSVKPDRVVLVDNGSTDSTAAVLRRWADAYPGDAVVVTEPTPGAPAARNRGLREVESDYVIFFDSDDLMPPHHIREVSARLSEAGFPELGAFDAVIRTLDGEKLPRPFRSRPSALFAHIFHGCLATQRMVVSTGLLERVGGWDESLPAWNDYELGMNMLAAGAQPVRLKLSAPVEIVRTRESITGVRFADKAGDWERSLDRCESILRQAGMNTAADLIDYRRAILAGEYRREGRPDLSRRLMAQIAHRRGLMALVARYSAAGGRGVAEIAKIFR